MERKPGQLPTSLFKYEKLILAEEETTSAGGCGVSLVAFSCPVSVCLFDSSAQGIFYRLKGARKYESELHLPRLWDTLGL